MARGFVTGDKEIERKLKQLSEKGADRVARNILNAQLRSLVKAMKAAAPVGPTGNLKQGLGSRLEKERRTHLQQAKAGIEVGKRSRKKAIKRLRAVGRTQYAPHGHLVGLGTEQRARKRIGGRFRVIQNPTPEQLSTGTMPANDFIRRATRSVMSTMKTAASKAFQRGFARELQKMRG